MKVHEILGEELENYKDIVKNGSTFSFNEFIKNEYYPNDKELVVIASISNKELSEFDFSNLDFQGVIFRNTEFKDCNFTDASLCDADLTNSCFNNCTLVNTDFRGANLYFTDFDYPNINKDTISLKLNGAYFSFSSLERLNKYLDRAAAKEEENIANTELKEIELEDKIKELDSLKHPNIFQSFWYKPDKTKIEELEKNINELKTRLEAEDTLRLFTGRNLDLIFELCDKENFRFDPLYISGSSPEERKQVRDYKPITEEDLMRFIAEAQDLQSPNEKLSIRKFLGIEGQNIIPDFSDLNLNNMKFINADLENCLFASCNMQQCSFENCNITGSNFEGANLNNAKFSKVDAKNAKFLFSNLNGVDIKGSDFQNAYMTKTDLNNAKINASNFEGIVLINADANGIDVNAVNINNSDLSGVSLAYARIMEVNLRKAVLNRSSLNGAMIESSDLEALEGQNSSFVDAKLINVLSANANYENSNLERAELKNAQFPNSNFKNANLKYANLEDANFENADLQFANLKGSKLESANMQGANLMDVNLANTKVQDANFDQAKMNDNTKAHSITGAAKGTVNYYISEQDHGPREANELFKEKDRRHKIKNNWFSKTRLGQGITKLTSYCAKKLLKLSTLKFGKKLAILGGVAVGAVAFAAMSPIFAPALMAAGLATVSTIAILGVASAACGAIAGRYIHKYKKSTENIMEQSINALEENILRENDSPHKSAKKNQNIRLNKTPTHPNVPITNRNSHYQRTK